MKRMKSGFKHMIVLIVMISIVSGCSPSEPDSSVTVFGQDRYFYGLNKDTGQVVWKVPTKEEAQEFPIILDGVAYGLGGDMYALNVKNGKLLWSIDGEKGLLPAMVSDHSLIGINLDQMDLFNTASQTKKSIRTDGYIGGGIVQDGILYYGTNNSKFIAFDIAKQTDKWRFDTKWRVVSPPVIVGDMVVFNEHDQQHTRFFYGLDRQTGTKKWEFDIQDDSSALAVSGEGLYYADDAGDIHALDIHTGNELWKASIGVSSTFSPVASNRIISFSSGGGIYGFDPNAKAVTWYKKIVPASQPVIIDSTLYVNSADGLHAIDAASGKEKWVFQGNLHLQPMIVGSMNPA